MPSPSHRLSRSLLAVAAATLVAASALLTTTASAALLDAPVTGSPGRLVLSSDPLPAQFLDLSPGSPRYWQVGARLEDADRATLSLQLRKDGALVAHPRGLTMAVRSCASPWDVTAAAPTCAAGERAITVATPADDYSTASPTFQLTPLATGAPQYLLIALAVEDSAAARADQTLMGLYGTMAVGLTATAVDPPPPPRGALAATGAAPLVAGVGIALALIVVGAGLRAHRRAVSS